MRIDTLYLYLTSQCFFDYILHSLCWTFNNGEKDIPFWIVSSLVACTEESLGKLLNDETYLHLDLILFSKKMLLYYKSCVVLFIVLFIIINNKFMSIGRAFKF